MRNARRAWIYDFLLVLVLAGAAYFRVLGLNWDADQHLHPDERFLTMVESALQVRKCATPQVPVELCPPDQIRWLGVGDYLDTRTSTLNPQNRGYGFFVYGDFPIVMVRYIAEWLGQTGYDQVHLVGRQVSALSDLLTILLIYIIAARLYDRRVALLGAAFSSTAVLQIQQSHFFTVDTVANLFIFLAVYFAVVILVQPNPPRSPQAGEPTDDFEDEGGEGVETRPAESGGSGTPVWHGFVGLVREPFFLLSLGFGASLALAAASKLNAAPLAILLPGAFLARYFAADRRQLDQDLPSAVTTYWSRIAICLLVGAATFGVVFRFAQPYAFDGLGLNPAWLANIRDLRAQSSGDADVPFALQWARRTHWFSFTNLTVWGLGLPLGILAWTGFVAMAWRILKGEVRHLLLWGWTALYFVWQSTVFNPTMRYQLPVYPLLCLIAAWFIVLLWELGAGQRRNWATAMLRVSSAILAVGVLVLTAAWAYAFTRIYTRPVTRVSATEWIRQNVPGPINLRIESADGSVYQQPLPYPADSPVTKDAPYTLPFVANASGRLKEIYLPHVTQAAADVSQTVRVSIGIRAQPSLPEQAIGSASVKSAPGTGGDARGADIALPISPPLSIEKGKTYTIRLESDGPLALTGAAPINETDWDDGLPLRLGAEAYDAYGGILQGGLNLQIYWDDNADKLQRFVGTLSRGDFIFMSSNRQWATVTRVAERYPLTTAYYRALIGCPATKDVIWCYNVAKPGMFSGQLGYKLVVVFESFPTIDIPGVLRWEANDQFAEEAFTVYDHPKVLIFQKQADFSASKVQALLAAVDLGHVVHLTPSQAGTYKSLMLPPAALAVQQAGGTWSELFDYRWIQNRFPAVGLLVWYLFILVLGVLTYPIVRLAFPGLGDKGYPVARVLGIVLLGYFSWLSGSAGLPVTRMTVWIVFAGLAAAGLVLGWIQRAELAQEWKSRRNYFLIIEAFFLAFFVIDLLIRLGNPDLWHPAKGGERPMDFSYFNAVLRSTSFPPYDPWFAGGYINYYYYGFVLLAMPVKLLGLVPTIAYNFILPTLFAMVAMGAFCVGWNLLDGSRGEGRSGEPADRIAGIDRRLVAGLLAAALLVLLGNLGTVRMLYQGLGRLAAPAASLEGADVVQRLLWAVQGAGRMLGGAGLPYGTGDWYWNPSRVIPPGSGNEITEFPLFTFLYSDLHAHMLAMPLAVLALAWALSVVRSRSISWISLLIGGITIGALYPTNLSDIYTYLPLGFAVVTYAIWRSKARGRWSFGPPDWLRKLALTVGCVVLLTALSYGLYEPYRAAYSQGYGALDPWTTSHTPIWSYLTHWGVFLFIITGWLAWETRQWLESTPLSSLNKLRPYQVVIEVGIAFVLAALLYLAYRGVEIGWVALPLAAWAGALMLRPGLPDVKRFALFIAGTALLITLVVEIVVVRGDIGRMNTVFKFYLQAWALLSVSSAAALIWLLPAMRQWLPGWRRLMEGGTAVLLAGAALYTITAGTDKISDRMAARVPLTLDSITYMQYAQYADFGETMNLVHDYRAIRWMQDHVQGSPVIVEANCPEYRWCTRFTIYTGLPGVVGWNWHQRQQRTLTTQLVEDRVGEIADFYKTSDARTASDFLRRYNVSYIILGQLERAEYAGAGLEKFAQYNGQLWDAVYQEGDTAIYEVRP